MVHESAARYQHPGKQLAGVQDQNARSLCRAASRNLAPQQQQNAEQPRPANDRVIKTRNAALKPSFQVRIFVIPHWAQVQQPGVPAAFKRVGCFQGGMVPVHVGLAIPPIPQTKGRVFPPIRQVGCKIDQERHNDVKRHTAHSSHPEFFPEARLFLLPAGIQHTQVQYRKPCPGINSGPLGCTPKPKCHAAQRHGQQRAVYAVLQHALAIPYHKICA